MLYVSYIFEREENTCTCHERKHCLYFDVYRTVVLEESSSEQALTTIIEYLTLYTNIIHVYILC